jgi:hypothetical protein
VIFWLDKSTRVILPLYPFGKINTSFILMTIRQVFIKF